LRARHNERRGGCGALRRDIDADHAADVLIGPLLFRRLLGHPELDDTAAESLVDVTTLGMSANL
jgi:hypothetical protein